MSVFDKDGYLPVDLKRTSLQANQLPFREELLQSITEDLIAHALVDMPDGCQGEWLDGKYEGFIGARPHQYYASESVRWTRWFIGSEGFILNDPHFIKRFDPKTLPLAIGGPRGYQEWGDKLRDLLPMNSLVGSLYPDVF